jgi:uncharacterized delta-60 repeat protein
LYVRPGASATVTGCNFFLNAADEGGGMAVIGGSATVTGCAFWANTATFGGGVAVGGDADAAGSISLVNCAIVDNAAAEFGGGVVVLGGDRSVGTSGGGATLANCTVVDNTAANGGGGAANAPESGGLSVVNGIFWGNMAGRGSQIINDDEFGEPSVRHSLVQGGWPGVGNADADPQFVRSPWQGPDGKWATRDEDVGDLRPRPGSAAVDLGDSAAVPAGVTTDIDGRPRVRGAAVDAGAFERQPDDPTVYEAERAVVTGATVSSSHPGFTGTGYVDYKNSAGDSIEFSVDAPQAGRYELTFRYANGGILDRRLALSVNGAPVGEGVNFAHSWSWSEWSDVTTTVTLAAGANTVKLTATGESGANVDAVLVRPLPPSSAAYQAESATLVGPLALSNVAGFTGSGFADYQHGSGDYVEFAIDVPASGAYALDFRYANGSASDRPLEVKVDGQALTGRLSFAPTGAWKNWSTSSKAATLSPGRHAVRLTSVGSNGPNLDALTVTASPIPPPVEPVTLQAESAAVSGAVVSRSKSGYTGTGYADYQNASGDFVEFTYDAPAARDYMLEFRYANGGTVDRPLELSVNGAVVVPGLWFGPTGSWTTWGTSSARATLAAGPNRVRVTATGRSGPNLDSLTLHLAPAGMDPTFGLDGVAIAPFDGSGGAAGTLAVQPDGKVVVAGAAGGEGGGLALARFAANGTLDPTFGGDGMAIEARAMASGGWHPAVTLQADGKILLVGGAPRSGGAWDEEDLSLSRYNPDGTRDTTFGRDGQAVNAVGDIAWPREVVALPDGKILVGGAVFTFGDPRGGPAPSDFMLARYTAAGKLDTTFGGGDGIVTADFGGGDGHTADRGLYLAVMGDGRIVLGGTVNGDPSDYARDIGLARFLPDGTPDPTFGRGGPDGDGLVTLDAGPNEWIQGLAVGADGSVTVAGMFISIATANSDYAVTRVTAAGALDPGFGGGDGRATIDQDDFDYVQGAAVTPAGKIVLFGNAGNWTLGVARFNADGTPDRSLSATGAARVPFPQGVSLWAGGGRTIAATDDGRLLAAAAAGDPGGHLDFALLRLTLL